MRVLLLMALMVPCLFAKTISIDISNDTPYFTVTLPANATTGYRWYLRKYDKAQFEFISSHYNANRGQMIGAPGSMSFKFRLNKGASYPKNTSMLFQYSRPWEPDKGDYMTATINFHDQNTCWCTDPFEQL